MKKIHRYIPLIIGLVVVSLLPVTLAHAQDSSAISIAASHLSSSWSWYLVRASGLIAAFCLFVLTLSGIGLVTGSTFKFLEPITAWASHRALGITLGISLLVHILMLLFDHFISFNVASILVPWVSNYQPVTIGGVSFGSLYVAMGILAFYLLALIIITSLYLINTKARLWKIVHLSSYLAAILVFFHALYMGTDTKEGLLHLLWIAAGLSAVVAVCFRLYRAGTLKLTRE